ncbi:hypothetical protein [Streptococcus marmotae]|uniref:hypothetical protein n=1 Tax=Streptococcus marmotae TaxID=1825069 RepID=UPI000836F68C|nr:hypothetical protein [Streptococcus marmotae]QBX16891.1 hypothetical protein Javan291_0015 [Streptococcus phage Javan291]
MNPQESFNELVNSLAMQIAEKALEAISERDRNIWLTQQELMDREGLSWREVKRMESYGLRFYKNGKRKEYCLADVNEVKHLMKQ